MLDDGTGKIRVAILVADESERVLAQRALEIHSAPDEITGYDGVLTGWTTEGDLEEIRTQGLMVKFSAAPKTAPGNESKIDPRSTELIDAAVEQAKRVADSGAPRPGFLGGASPTSVVEGTLEIEVTGPMRPLWREDLAKKGMKVLERAGRSSWLVSGDLNALENLLTHEWIRKIRVPETRDDATAETGYTEEATAAYPDDDGSLGMTSVQSHRSTAETSAEAVAKGSADKPTCYDAYLYQSGSMEEVLAMIKSADLKVVESSDDALRFHGPGAEEVANQLKALPTVRFAGKYTPPNLYCDAGLTTIGWHKVNPNPASPLWSGAGEVIGVADSGVDSGHPDLAGAIKNTFTFPGALPSDTNGHGTHVCGIAVGRGASVVTGVAPKADAVVRVMLAADGSFVLPLDYGEIFQPMVDAKASILNLSWGWALGGDYDQGSWQVDTYAHAHPEVLMVISAGNDGRSSPDGTHKVRTLGAPASSKNAITVGASTLLCPKLTKPDGSLECSKCSLTWGTFRANAIKHPPASDEDVCGASVAVAGISSRGPTRFQAIKPDILAPGVLVQSSRSQYTPGLQPIFEVGCPEKNPALSACATGTSMAAPFVSGAAAVLRQWLRDKVGIATPSAALLKACLISCASRLPATRIPSAGYPDYDQGYGLLDLSLLFKANGDTVAGFICADVASNSREGLASRMAPNAVIRSQHLIRFSVPAGASGPLRVCLTWTDLPGKHLQNNLQLDLQIPDGTYRLGNDERIYGTDPLDPTAGDMQNNVEVIDVPNPVAGLYRARVFAESTLFPNPSGGDPLTTTAGSQGFALTIMGPVNSGVDIRTRSQRVARLDGFSVL